MKEYLPEDKLFPREYQHAADGGNHAGDLPDGGQGVQVGDKQQHDGKQANSPPATGFTNSNLLDLPFCPKMTEAQAFNLGLQAFLAFFASRDS